MILPLDNSHSFAFNSFRSLEELCLTLRAARNDALPVPRPRATPPPEHGDDEQHGGPPRVVLQGNDDDIHPR